MNISRTWVTPLAVGTFLLTAVTGVLMFFHRDVGLNRMAHEWLSLAFIAAALLHMAVNFGAIRFHLTNRVGVSVIALFVLLLGLSFLPVPRKSSPMAAPALALARAPLSLVAQVARVDSEKILERLRAAGLSVESSGQTVAELVGPDPRRQIQVLGRLFAE